VSRWILFFLTLLVSVVTLAVLAWANPTASEMVFGAVGLLTSLFTSPIILEATVAFIGLIIVMTYNQRKLEREGKDEWVVLPKEESPTEVKEKPPVP
jgi:uncharacterized membrane protein